MKANGREVLTPGFVPSESDEEEIEGGNAVDQVDIQDVPMRKEEEKENRSHIYNMKAIARKVLTPWFVHSESDEED